MLKQYLTGIKPTGEVHFGNYLSVIQPLESLTHQESNNLFFCFIADGHSLTKSQKSEELKSSILNVAATWMSCDLNTNTYIYRQSQIPEIFEIFWILSCFTAKGHLNRCHAYHSLTEENKEKGKDPDKGIFAGLYNYPALMASDILTFDVDEVPIGKDQKQHLEITQDIARKFNHVYKTSEFKIPQDIYLTEEEIPGLDGRKMSKSYDNHIPLFCSEKKLRKLIFSIPTNSKSEGEVKYPEESDVVKLMDLVAQSNTYSEAIRNMLSRGDGWGDIKQYAFETINRRISDKRERYNNLMNNKIDIINTLIENEEKYIRPIAQEKLHKLKHIIGLH